MTAEKSYNTDESARYFTEHSGACFEDDDTGTMDQSVGQHHYQSRLRMWSTHAWSGDYQWNYQAAVGVSNFVGHTTHEA